MFQDIDRITDFAIQLSVIVGLIGGIAAWLKRSINQGMVTQEQLEKAIEAVKVHAEENTAEKIAIHKEQTEKADAADKTWLNTLQGKVEQNGKDIAEIRGKVS